VSEHAAPLGERGDVAEDREQPHPEPGVDGAGVEGQAGIDAPGAGPRRARIARSSKAALALGALGVVFGDIGTSPLYALQTVFTADNGRVVPHPAEIYGVISLVFWSITMIVSIKYVTFIMRASNDGEGGIMALTALLRKLTFRNTGAQVVLIALGVFGASLFYGDGIITPAISLLSAVEGVKVAEPGLDHLVLPITIGIVIVLFAIQRFGTGVVGRLFGPIMIVWFTTIAVAGLHEVIKRPDILRSLSPTYGLQFIVDHGTLAFIALGSIVLAVTGAEALYADMGHFGRPPIARAWFFVVFPALVLNYMGQGALILHSPSSISNPFYLLLPHWAQLPMVFLATVATVIASQSVISGAFSVTRQAVQLRFLPRLTIRHTSSHEVGQVYVPAVNAILFVSVLVLILGFRTSASLASAYGVAVTATFALNTVLFLVIARHAWHWSRWVIGLLGVVFLTTELSFFAANLTKIAHGGWLPLAVAATVFVVLMTWQRGQSIVSRNRTDEEGALEPFLEDVRSMDPPIARVAGTAVFLSPGIDTTPLALRANVEHNKVLHEHVIIVCVETLNVPHVLESERIELHDVGTEDDGIIALVLRFGFQDLPKVPAALQLAHERGVHPDIDLGEVTYFLSRIFIVRTDAPGMMVWRKRLFLGMAHNASSLLEYFDLPMDRVISMSAQIEV
jgi:KUP system potassium uptake protein